MVKDHDYLASRIVGARTAELYHRANQEGLFRDLRRDRRRQLALWICFRLQRFGRYLVGLGERIERAERFDASRLAPSDGS